MAHALKLISLILLWFSIGFIGLLISWFYGLVLGAFFVGICYWIWCLLIDRLIWWLG